MQKAIFRGKEYEFDGTNVYCEGKKINNEPITVITQAALSKHLEG